MGLVLGSEAKHLQAGITKHQGSFELTSQLLLIPFPTGLSCHWSCHKCTGLPGAGLGGP